MLKTYGKVYLMKRKISKEVIILIIIIPAFLLGTMAISQFRSEYDYSVSGKGSSGFSVFYEAMNKLGLNALRQSSELKEVIPGELQVITLSSGFDVEDKGIVKWIESGGNLLIIVPGGDLKLPYGTEEKDSKVKSYLYGKGRVIIADGDKLTNKAVYKDTSEAYRLVDFIEASGYKSVKFNEYYMYGRGEKPSLWRDTPFGIKLVIYQCAIILILLVFYKGSRFGRPVCLYEEAERAENEYVYSAAQLYKKAGCYDMVLNTFVDSLLQHIKKTIKIHKEVTKENWIELWEQEQLPYPNKARSVFNDINYADTHQNHKAAIKAVSEIEELMEVLEKRREMNWKQKNMIIPMK